MRTSICSFSLLFFFFFNDTATTEIYTLSLHDALPISRQRRQLRDLRRVVARRGPGREPRRRAHDRHGDRRRDRARRAGDRKSTRLNSSHGYISYAVFCLKKKKNKADSEATKLSDRDNR